MFKLFKNIKEYNKNKEDYNKYKLNEKSFNDYTKDKENYDTYLLHKENFEKYNDMVSKRDGYFIMYAKEIDSEGNITFMYDFDEKFPKVLRNQGIAGIEDIDVIEEYLHYIFSQNYFENMLEKSIKESKE